MMNYAYLLLCTAALNGLFSEENADAKNWGDLMRNHDQEQPLEKGCDHCDDKDTCAHVYVPPDNTKSKT